MHLKDFGIYKLEKSSKTILRVEISKDENTTLMVGDKIDYQVGYGDATVFLHDIICGLRNQKLEKVWKIQGRGKTA